MKILFLILSTILLIGCAASNKQIKEAMDPWINNNIQSLIIKWGPPSQVTQMPYGGTIYTWVYNGGTQLTGSSTNIYGTSYSSYSAYNTYCKIDWFVDENGTIRTYRHEGQCVIKK